jgi:hypothetical protein
MVNKLARSEDLQNMVCGSSSGKRLNPDSSTTGKKTEKINLYIREEKIKEAKEKSRRGYYNNPEVFSKIAQRLVDLLGR